jgi:hypothetical protein
MNDDAIESLGCVSIGINSSGKSDTEGATVHVFVYNHNNNNNNNNKRCVCVRGGGGVNKLGEEGMEWWWGGRERWLIYGGQCE